MTRNQPGLRVTFGELLLWHLEYRVAARGDRLRVRRLFGLLSQSRAA